MEKVIRHERDTYTAKTTTGEVIHPDTCDRWCYVLEDTVRPDGIKVKSHTAIPALRYKVAVTYSPRFKRDMILLYNTENYTIEHKGVKFEGVRVHGGSTHENTGGCPLVAYNKLNNDTIQGTAEKELCKQVKEWMAEGYDVYWEIFNLPQSE